MFIFTTRFSAKKLFLLMLPVLIGAILWLCLFRAPAEETGNTIILKNNEERLAYLRSLGWEMTPEPLETLQLLLPETLTENYFVLHVCGKGNIVKSALKNYRQFEFIADMGMAYACADLVISRAGAGTIFELLALKKPALLIPLEGQTRGDQVENAAYFQAKGLCHVLKQSHLFTLPQAVEEAFTDDEMKKRLQENTFQSGNPCILAELKKVLQ